MSRTSCPTRSRPSAANCATSRSRTSSLARPSRQSATAAGRQGRPDGRWRQGRPKRTGKAKVDQYVELQREKTDRIFVILRSSATSGTRATRTRTPRPTIARAGHASTVRCTTRSREPDRAVGQLDGLAAGLQRRALPADCTSAPATSDESLKTYYETQSSGRYTVDGEVTDWVKVRYNEARYGRSNGFPCAGNVCSNTWALVRDAANQWYADQIAPGRTERRGQRRAGRASTSGTATTTTATATSTSPTATSTTSRSSTPAATRPTVTRSRARTPSGATAGRRSRAPARARPASRSAAPRSATAASGSATTRSSRKTAAAASSSTSTPTTSACRTTTTRPARGDNPNEYWTLMAQSRLGAKGEPFIGDRAGDLGAWNKLQLGWLDYEVVPAGVKDTGSTSARRSTTPTRRRPWSFRCPRRTSVTELGAPAAGTKQWWSGDGDDLDNTLTPYASTLPAGASATPDVQGPLRHRGLWPGPVRLRLRRGRTDGGATGPRSRARSPTRRGRGRPASTASSRRLDRRDLRPVGVRRQDDRPAVPLRDRRRRAGNDPAAAERSVR